MNPARGDLRQKVQHETYQLIKLGFRGLRGIGQCRQVLSQRRFPIHSADVLEVVRLALAARRRSPSFMN